MLPSRPVNIVELRAAAGAQAGAGLFDARKKARVVYEPVIEPVVLRAEPDQQAGRLAVPRDDDLFRLSRTQIAREIVFYLG